MANLQNTSRKIEDQPMEYVSHFKNYGLGAVIDLQKSGPENVSFRLETVLKKFFSEIKIFKDNPSQTDMVVQKFFEKISSDGQVKIQDLQTAQIDNAVLTLTKKDGTHIHFDFVELWKNIFIEPSKEQVRVKAREEERKLQEIIAKDAFYNGSVVMEYIAGTVVSGGTIMIGTSVGKMLYARSMVVTLEDGTKQRINFEKLYVGTREAFSDAIGRILEFSGIHYDPKTKKMFRPVARLIKAYGDDLKNLSYDKFYADPDSPKMSREQFENWKKQALQKQGILLADANAGKITVANFSKQMRSTFAIGKGDFLFSAALFPVFATEFHQKHTPLGLASAIVDEAGGWAGAKVGMRAGSKLPGWGKLLGVAVGGALGAVGAGKVFDSKLVDASRRKWLIDGTQEMYYNDNRSRTIHGLSSFFINEGLGLANDAWRFVTGDKNAGGIDIGLDRTNVMLPFFDKKLFTIPEINLFQDKLNMGTSPWEWISQSTRRDVHMWNDYVDKYKIQLTESINDLLGKYQRNESIFADTDLVNSIGGKEKFLESTLYAVLNADGKGSIFSNEMTNVVEGIMFEIENNSTIPNSTINEYILKNVGLMKINNLYKIDRRLQLDSMKNNLIASIPMIASNDVKNMEYLASIPDRMISNRQLFENDDEERIFKNLLSNTKTQVEFSGQKMSVGHAMASWLDDLVRWQDEVDFLNQLDKGNSSGIRWD